MARATDFLRSILPRDFGQPAPDAETAGHLARALLRLKIDQETATDATLSMGIIRQSNLRIVAARALVRVVAAAGEDMTVDILKNGSTVLTAPIVIDSTIAARTWVAGSLLLNTVPNLLIGDRIKADLDYTAGGAPTPIVDTYVEVDLQYVGGDR